MAGWNNKNCCCEPKTYTCGNGEVNICCVVLEVSTWSRPVTLHAYGLTPNDSCEYADLPYHHNNVCGFMGLPDYTCAIPRVSVSWTWRSEGRTGVEENGSIALQVDIARHRNTVTGELTGLSHVIAGLDPDTWYLSPIVFTVSGVTYTVTVCSEYMYYLYDVFPDWPEIPTFFEVRSGSVVLGRVTGNRRCGNPCDTSVLTNWHATWAYDIYLDKVQLFVHYGRHGGEILIDYADGDWADDTHLITLTAPGLSDITITLSPVDSCDIPSPCEVSNACFPDGCPCIIDGSDGSLYRRLYADVSGPVTHTALELDTYLDEGWDYTQAFPGTDSLVIRCTNGGLDHYYVAAVFGGVNYFFSIPAGGIDCDPADTNQIRDIILTDGTITIRIYTL